jgi:hypothetical protein
MQKLWQKIRGEWERTAFGVAVLMALVCLGYWVFGLGARRGGTVPPEQIRPPVAIINAETAFKFIEEPRGIALTGTSAFHFQTAEPPKAVERPPKRQPWAQPERPPARPQPDDGKAPQPRPKPPPARVTRALEFCGTMTTPTGVSLALVKDVKKGETFFVRANQQVFGLEVVAFSGDEISFRNRSGDLASVKFGEARELEVE